MQELKYKKIICRNGHCSKVVPLSYPYPAECPECGMPYDRRVDHWVLCDEDGNTLSAGTESESARCQADEERDKVPIAGIVKTPSDTTGYDQQADSTIHIPQRRRMEMQDDISGIETGVRRRGIREKGLQENAEERPFRDHNNTYIYSGSIVFSVPEGGLVLGREMESGELSCNMLISRKHAFVQKAPTGGIILKDEGSLNGTFYDNGSGRVKLAEGKAEVINSGGKFWLADQMFVVEEE